jgi:hypothetical protein
VGVQRDRRVLVPTTALPVVSLNRGRDETTRTARF